MTEIVVDISGNVRCVYGESIDLHSIGDLHIRRASHVEPDESGAWRADLSPVGGPTVGPFPSRSAALAAESSWLSANWLLTLQCPA
ncbi:MAG: hypothetical protein WBD40_22100 [Tepidisphaeraceae bacterium]